MRAGIIAILHETNTFLASPTSFADFEHDLLVTGDVLRARFDGAHHEVAGFLAALEEERLEAVPLLAARAHPSGLVEHVALERILERLDTELDRSPPLDGILVAAHGAMVTDRERDADGYWLSRLRARLGRKTPIVLTVDPHANLSRRMVDACDASIAYRTNPHIDQRQTGEKAAHLLARTLSGEVRPVTALAQPAMAISIECQCTTEPPCLPVYELADAMLDRPGILSNSIALGFPYADVEDMGSSVVVVADADRELAEKLAAELAAELWSRREEFRGRFTSIEAALERAARLEGRVCLLDMGDNVGGGSPGDGTYLLRALHDRAIQDSLVVLFDPESVAAAERAGPGARVRLALGGKTDRLHGPPLETECTVLGVYDGRFEETEPRHGGISNFDQGRTAVVATRGGPTVVLTSRRMAPFSLRQLTSSGIDPSAFRILVAKGVHAPVAAYRAVCRHFVRVDTPGITAADMRRLEYRFRRRPMFPFEPGEH